MPKEFKLEKKIKGLAACLLFTTLLYFAVFGMTIKNISEYQGSEKQISALTADMSKMEFEYLSKESTINQELAAQKGFVEPTNIVIARESAQSIALARGEPK